jgi:lysophosphatidylcholine acyltransferase / lyso-PAF acetyltransferase
MQGTTTNGRYLLPFKTGAFVAGKPIQPVLISYGQARGKPALSWETIGALRHVFLVLSFLIHSACIIELPLYQPSKEEQSNPALFARNVRMYMVRIAAMKCAAVHHCRTI